MKKIFIQFILLGAMALLLPAGVAAQQTDVRQRTTETIVADGLAQLPAQNVQVFNQVMGEIAATGEQGVEAIAALFVPASKGKNATLEYALSGVVAYVTDPAHESLRAGVRRGLFTAIDQCKDDANRAFFLSQLQLCSTTEDAPAIARYLDDPYLSDFALRALISTTDSDALLLQLGSDNDLSSVRKRMLAYAYGEKRMAQAEPLLLKWLTTAEGTTAEVIYNALAFCGSQNAIKPLGAAAAKTGYKWDGADATDSYLRLLARLANDGDAQAIKSSKNLLKNDHQYIRGAGLAILVDALGAEKAMPYVLKGIEEGPAEYRFAALESLGKSNDQQFAQVAAVLPRLDGVGQAAVLAWLGERGAVSQSKVITAAVASSDDRVAKAAIEASGRIGGDEALSALVAALDGAHSQEAVATLLTFNGKINPAIENLLVKEDPKMLVPALKLAAARRMTSVAGRVFTLLGASDSEVRKAAYEALPYVAQPADMDRLAKLLDGSDAAHVQALQLALIRTSSQLPADDQYTKIAAYMKVSKTPARYYPVLAQSATQDAIASLVEGLRSGDGDAAFDALLTVESPAMIDILQNIAAGNPARADRALMRYAVLVSKADLQPMQRFLLYGQGLELKPSAAVENKLLGYVSGIYTYPALMLASDYLDYSETSAQAAAAVKTIVAKSNPMLGGDAVRAALEKSREIYRALAKENADAGYAVDEIGELLSKIPATGFVSLSKDGIEGWMPTVVSSAKTAKLSKRQIQDLLARNTKAVESNWGSMDGIIAFTGKTPCAIGTQKKYENFELWMEWSAADEAMLGLRGLPFVRLGGNAGTGIVGIENPEAKSVDNREYKWNTLYIKVVDDRIFMIANGIVIAQNVVLTNLADPQQPLPAAGAIDLIGENSPASFRNIYVNELPATPLFTLSHEEAKEGYEVLFDGRSLHKWTGNTTNYVPLDGTIDVTANYGGSGNLYTVKEYGDFVLRFEFRFLREGVNNGIGIRTPMGVDAAFEGMEIQVLDHDAPIYKDLHEYQQHGSVYGVIPAKRVKFGELGTWNTEEIRAVGDRITVTVNGKVILDGNIREACQGHNVAPDGSKKNPYMIDNRNHPGLFNKSGHLGLLGHGSGLQFRNLRVKSLDAKQK